MKGLTFFSFKKEEKKIKFPKRKQENVQIKPRKISQRTANFLLLSFIVGMVGLASLVIVSNMVRTLRGEKKVVQVTNQDSRNLSNKVGLFMTDFLNSYFSDNSPENQAKLKKFYGAGVDVKNTKTTNLESKLTGAVLIEITNHLATYRVGYAVKVNNEWKNNVGVINIPYGVKNNKYYVSDLPYFTDEDSYIAKNPKNKIQLNLQADDAKYAKAKEYVEAFFKAYASGDKTQMSPFSKEVRPVSGYVFKSVDYSYFIQDKPKADVLVNIVQVTFTDGLGLTHQENFTLTLQVDKKEETYRVQKLEYGISKKYVAELK